MGQIARTALLDASDALIYETNGTEISFMPPGAHISFDFTYSGWDLFLPMYEEKGEGDLCFTFYVDAIGEYIESEIWQGQKLQILNDEESSVLREVFDHLCDEGFITND